MPLNKTGFIAGIKGLVAGMRAKIADDDDYYATQLADLIEAFIKSGDVKTGITVRTTGSASLQTGVTTSIGKIE